MSQSKNIPILRIVPTSSELEIQPTEEESFQLIEADLLTTLMAEAEVLKYLNQRITESEETPWNIKLRVNDATARLNFAVRELQRCGFNPAEHAVEVLEYSDFDPGDVVVFAIMPASAVGKLQNNAKTEGYDKLAKYAGDLLAKLPEVRTSDSTLVFAEVPLYEVEVIEGIEPP